MQTTSTIVSLHTTPGVSRYASLAAALRARVVSGEWPPGTALPAESLLASEHQVALGTMRRALELLELNQQAIIAAEVEARSSAARQGACGIADGLAQGADHPCRDGDRREVARAAGYLGGHVRIGGVAQAEHHLSESHAVGHGVMEAADESRAAAAVIKRDLLDQGDDVTHRGRQLRPQVAHIGHLVARKGGIFYSGG